MPGFPPGRRGDAASSTEAQEGSQADLFQDQSGLPASSLNEEEDAGSWSRDGDRQGGGELEKRWLLWHEFMTEHAHLDTWLGLVELAVSFPNRPVSYAAAKEELRRFERLRGEAGSRLVQLDGLTRRNRTLAAMFRGAMRRRLLAFARESGKRWDEANAKLESVAGRLKLFVSEWEEFESETEELSLWLADLDVRLAEVDHLTGNTCEKLRQLQSFQQCVCVNSGRVNALLRRGEALIQRSQSADAQHIESRLLELLRHCSLVYNDIARTHTRLLSMRLVFEDDWILSPPTDSGCPSESVVEEEGALDRTKLDVPDGSNPRAPPSPRKLPPPPSPSVPTPDHLGLEWDPSVDIGRSVSCDDADSSYFSASTGRCHRHGVKRRSYLSSLGSMSDISQDNQEADPNLEGWLGHAHPGSLSPIETQGGGTGLTGDQWVTSTPDRQDSQPLRFDGGRVRAWLGVQGPAPPEGRTSCSKAMQTDGEFHLEEKHIKGSNQEGRRDNAGLPFAAPAPSLSHGLKASSDWTKHRQAEVEADGEQPCREGAEPRLPARSGTPGSRAPSSLRPPALACLLLAAALVLLACLIWIALEPPCQRRGRTPRGFHLTLSYVNGPPPT